MVGRFDKQKAAGTGEEEYFTFAERRGKNPSDDESGAGHDFRQSLDFFSKIKEINANFKALKRLQRPRKYIQTSTITMSI